MSRIPVAVTDLTITNPAQAWVSLQDLHNAAIEVRKLGEATRRILDEMHDRVGQEGADELVKATATVAGELASSIASFGIGLERDVCALDGVLSASLLKMERAPGCAAVGTGGKA